MGHPRRYAKKMKLHKKLKFVVIAILLMSIVASVGLRRDHRHPNQHMNRYWAVRSIDVWTFFGYEIYAKNHLAVYDMNGRTITDLPEPINRPELQIRRFGEIVEGDRQFNLGEDNYDKDGCVDYIYWVLGTSSDADHRIEATPVFRRSLSLYPLTTQLRDALISDPSKNVRSRMKAMLAHSH